MRAHLAIDLETGAVELHTDTDPKPAVKAAVRGKDQRKRKRKKPSKAVKLAGTMITAIEEGDLMN